MIENVIKIPPSFGGICFQCTFCHIRTEKLEFFPGRIVASREQLDRSRIGQVCRELSLVDVQSYAHDAGTDLRFVKDILNQHPAYFPVTYIYVIRPLYSCLNAFVCQIQAEGKGRYFSNQERILHVKRLELGVTTEFQGHGESQVFSTAAMPLVIPLSTTFCLVLCRDD